MELTDSAISLLRQRYCNTGESPKDVYPRVATALGKMQNGEDWASKFQAVMESGEFLPNSPCLRNAGFSNQVKACFVLEIEDSMESIFKTLHNSAMIFKSGGGVGYNFSALREKGAVLSHGGTSSGVLSFMKIYDAITDAIKQGGMRRGASMGVLDYDHPDILDFVTEKVRNGVLTNLNISVLVDNDFMKGIEGDDVVALRARKDKRVVKGTIRARDLFSMITYNAWICGDPGMLFYDRINQDNPYFPKYPIKATNPCGEVPLLPYESCCLGSLNLAQHLTTDGDLDITKLEQSIETGTHFLMAMNKICEFPIPECYIAQSKYLRIGLGVMGFADLLIAMHIKYDSPEALAVIDKIGKLMQKAHTYAPQSVAVLSIAPTGSLSILGNCSSGIEPIFSANYERHITIGVVKEKRDVSEYLRTAHEIEPEWHLKVQARWQKWIDNGVSKTVNLPSEATIQDVQDIYMTAWKSGCKGITVFRDGCKDGVFHKASKCENEDCHL
jgi:ribonucleoside-diphosphate reductase alpha chain